MDEEASDDVAVASNSHDLRVQSARRHVVGGAQRLPAALVVDGELRMAYKKVTLVNNSKAIYTLSFLV